MCSIISGFNKDRVKELAKLNSYRGQHSHSVFVYDTSTTNILYQYKDFGPLDLDSHDLPDGYIICHQQAPTTDNKNTTSIHPARLDYNLLYHNGIIKSQEIRRLSASMNCPDITWDTMLILKQLIDTGFPNNIDGTFSCIWHTESELYVFRNEISPLFFDCITIDGKPDIVLSSTKFDGGASLEPNIIFKLNLLECSLESVSTFTTKENPYFLNNT